MLAKVGSRRLARIDECFCPFLRALQHCSTENNKYNDNDSNEKKKEGRTEAERQSVFALPLYIAPRPNCFLCRQTWKNCEAILATYPSISFGKLLNSAVFVRPGDTATAIMLLGLHTGLVSPTCTENKNKGKLVSRFSLAVEREKSRSHTMISLCVKRRFNSMEKRRLASLELAYRVYQLRLKYPLSG